MEPVIIIKKRKKKYREWLLSKSEIVKTTGITLENELTQRNGWSFHLHLAITNLQSRLV